MQKPAFRKFQTKYEVENFDSFGYSDLSHYSTHIYLNNIHYWVQQCILLKHIFQRYNCDCTFNSPFTSLIHRNIFCRFQKSASSTTFDHSELVSPTSTIESLTREFEHSLDRLPSVKSTKSEKTVRTDSKSSTLRSGHSLDITQVLKGQFVVKPQDTESLKAQGSMISKNSSDEERDKRESDKGLAVDRSRDSSGRSSLGHYSLGPHR